MTRKVKIDRLSKRYGDVAALKDVSLDVNEGEFLTLLGPSGSGKTTLLMILAGLVEPSSGRVWIDGLDSTDLPSFRRDIGLVFQNYALFPHLSIFENIAFPLRMRRLKEDEIRSKVAEILTAVKLPEVANRLPRELSGGQQQRIALARCVVYKPSIVLMDEPLGALDKRLREQLQLEIKRLHRELGMTILYVTHDQEEAMAMSDRICLMNGGEIEQLGPPSQLYFQPVSLFSGDFLGESNLFKGSVGLVRDGRVHIDTVCGHTITAKAMNSLKSGQSVTCLVRPESFRLLENGARLENEVEAEVQEILVVGGITRIYARLSDGTKVLSIRLTSRSQLELKGGAVAKFGWSSEDSVTV